MERGDEMPRMQWQSELAQLRQDNRANAQEILYRAVDLLIDAIGDSIPGGAISYRRWLVRTGRELVAAQPTVGELYRLVNDMLWPATRPWAAKRSASKPWISSKAIAPQPMRPWSNWPNMRPRPCCLMR